MKLFIGNISYNTTEETLRTFFEQFGAIVSAKIVTDRETGRSRGFGFVEFADATSANEAIATANGAMLDGKQLVVSEARPKEGGAGPRRSDSGRGGFGGGNGGGNSYGGGSRSSEGGGGRSRGGYAGGRW